MIRTYTELMTLSTFEERYEYLKLNSSVGKETFGYDRWLNQKFYTSQRWKSLRDAIIIRDNGCDLAYPDRPIYGQILIHHLNPVSKEDILQGSDLLWNPDFLVCVSKETHNAIHYGAYKKLSEQDVTRKPGDTCPWR